MDESYISYRHIGWLFYIFLAIILGALSVFINPVFIIVAIIGIINTYFIFKYPMWGLITYLIVFLLRPGELFPAIAILRPELLMGILAGLSLILHQKIEFGNVIIPKDQLTISLVAILVAILLSLFTSYEKSETLSMATGFIKLLIFYYLIISLITTKKRFISFITIFAFIIVYIALSSYWDYLMGDFVHTMDVDRLTGNTSAGGDANSLGATLVTTIPIMTALAIYYRNYLLKIVFVLLSTFMAMMMVITASRSALLAFIGIIIGGISYSRHKLRNFSLAVILCIVGWFLLPQQYQERYMKFSEVDDSLNNVSSGRIEIWLAGLRMIPNRPIFGVGAGAFAWAYNTGEFGPPAFMQSHNLYLEIICTMGVVGVAAWLFFIITFLRKLRWLIYIRRSGESFWLILFSKSFIIVIYALLISGLFGHNLYRFTWFMLAGLAVALYNIRMEEFPNEKEING